MSVIPAIRVTLKPASHDTSTSLLGWWLYLRGYRSGDVVVMIAGCRPLATSHRVEFLQHKTTDIQTLNMLIIRT